MSRKQLTAFKIKPLPEEKRFQFLLQFHDQSQPVEFETTFDHAMMILKVLNDFQVQYKLPIPLRPPAKGKPKLGIVKPDE